MPLYEYQCQNCGERVEIIQNFSDPPYSICPKCGGEMKKLFSAPAIQFKGSGFYKTDYGSSGSGASGSPSSPSSPSSSSSQSTSTDSKTTKADSKE